MKAHLRIIRDEKAATAIEYGLILAIVVLGVMGGMTLLANTTTGMWNNVSATVQTNG